MRRLQLKRCAKQHRLNHPANHQMLIDKESGDVAQLEEHRLCKPGVVGSSPIVSTRNTMATKQVERL